jgi:predicted nucleotidyltransferase
LKTPVFFHSVAGLPPDDHRSLDRLRVPPARLLTAVLTAFAILNAGATAYPSQRLPSTPWYNETALADTTATDWMAQLPDLLLVSELSVPGTHESHAYYGPSWPSEEWCGICQRLPLRLQLKAGIRAFDIRLRHYDNHLQTYHGPVPEQCNFNEGCWANKCGSGGILVACTEFLEDHPGETIFLRIKANCGSVLIEGYYCLNNSLSFSEAVEAALAMYPGYIYEWPVESCEHMPTLGDVRGKIVILQDFVGDYHVGDRDNSDWRRQKGRVSCVFDHDPGTDLGPDLCVISEYDHENDSAAVGFENYGLSPGTFTRGFVLDTESYDQWASVCSGDFDSNDYDDLALINRTDNSVDVFLFDAPGNCYSQASYDVGMLPLSSVTADFDADGDLDIVVTAWELYNLFELYMLSNNGDGTFLVEKKGTRDSPYGLAVANLCWCEVFTYIATGLPGVYSGSVAWGDYDKDGDLDILMTGYRGSERISRVYQNEEDSFTDIAAGLPGVRYSSVAWGDYDNDGDLDILLTGESGSGPISRVYRNDGNRVFTDIGAGLEGVYESSVAWGDYDNDGDLDILLTGRTSSDTVISRVYRNDGNRVFTDIGAGLPGVYLGSVAWDDYDKDGDLDILMTGYTGSERISRVYQNEEDSFTDIAAGLPGVRYSSVAWGDYDNDGDLDILLTGESGSGPISRVYRNEGIGVFTDIGAGLEGVYESSVAWGDYDDDKDLDILLTGRTDVEGISRVYAGNGNGVFTDIDAGLPGLYYGSAAWGDYDKDGDLDILLTGTSSLSPLAGMSLVYLYRNDGDDKYPDLITTHQSKELVYPNHDYVRAELNPFGPEPSVYCDIDCGVDTYPEQVVAADFDGDGLDDAAVSFRDGYVKLFRNDGSTLLNVISLTTGGEPRALVAADFDNDNDPDLAVAIPAWQTGKPGIQVWVNNGYNPFPVWSWSNYTIRVWSNHPVGLSAADFDIDGDVDLAVTEWGPCDDSWGLDRAYVLRNPLNQGGGQHWCPGKVLGPYWNYLRIQDFYALTGWDVGGVASKVDSIRRHIDRARESATEEPEALFVNFLSGVDWPSGSLSCAIQPRAVANATGCSTYVYLTDALNAGEVWRCGIVMADFPGDGLIDAVIGHNPYGQFEYIGAGLPGVCFSSVAWGDYDNDGDLDILMTGDTGSELISCVYRNDGNGIFTDIGAGLPGVCFSSVAWGDYDNDGDLDILMTGEYWPGARISCVYRNDGNGVFTDIVAGLPGLCYGSAAWGDYDNDGDLDILMTGVSSSGRISSVYRNDPNDRNDGNRVFTDIGAGLPEVCFSSVAWGDYDNDGDLDILMTGDTGSELISCVYRNDGNGIFTDIGAGLPEVSFSSVAWGDYDNDGDLDILLTGRTNSDTVISRVYRNDGNDGNRVFTDIAAGLPGVRYSSAAWGDYDNDGDLDILLTGQSEAGHTGDMRVSRVYRNDLSSFSRDFSWLVPVARSSAVWGDYDTDGDLDILLTGESVRQGAATEYSVNTVVYRNKCSTANTAPSPPTGLSAVHGETTATFGWNAATDGQTPADGLTYNLRVGTTPGGEEISAAMADTGTGYRWVVALGNANQNTRWSIDIEEPQGTPYYWSVQAVDGAFAGSEFAPEEVFVVPVPSAVAPLVPAQNALHVPVSTDISVMFNVDVDAATINDDTFVVHGMSSGPHVGAIVHDGPTRTATLDPAQDFAEGEIVTVVLTGGIESSAGIPIVDYAWSFTAAAVGGSGRFSAATSYAAGNGPRSVLASDLDGDGDVDLATADQYSDYVSVLLNQGYGTFAPAAAYPAGAEPFCVFACDLDGDGYPDLATANRESDDVSVLINQGDGTFAGAVAYPAGDGPWSVFASDLDGDGDFDLITANGYFNDVSVLINQGDGTFAGAVAYPAGDGPRSVFASDLDSDGDLDLATANYASDNVSVLLNEGDGTFSAPTSYAAGDGPCSVFASDLDGDGDIDLATANVSSEDVSVLMNQGDGTFEPAVAHPAGGGPWSVFASDLDGDGNPDLVTANYDSGEVSVLLNGGNGAFSAPTSYAAGDRPGSVFASDLDGDGDLDLAAANSPPGDVDCVSVLLNASPMLSASPVSLVFDEVPVGQTTCDTIRIVNDGGWTCTISSISGCEAEPFSLDTSMTSLELTPGDTAEIAVCVAPMGAGPDSCAVTIESNAVNDPTIIPVRLDVVTGVPSDTTPKPFRIVSVVPNPFNASTTVHFTLPDKMSVSVEVFSVAGGRVRVLADEALLGPGDVRLTWDGMTDHGLMAGSGVYFIRVETHLGSKTTRAVLLK